MLSRLATRAFDAALRPQITRFSLTCALRMNKAEILRGSAVAANAVFDAYRAQLHGDSTQLAALAESGSLQPRLHEFLESATLFPTETAQIDDTVIGAIEQALSKTEEALQTTPTLRGMRLIVGARRSTFESDRFVRKHKCTLGSHLVVVDERPRGLWLSERQRQLLFEEGCTVQCMVDFSSRSVASSYVLEAEVAGHMLLPEQPDALDLLTEHEDLQFSVVDLNGVLGGNEFWGEAKEVAGLHQVMAL